MRTVQLIIDQLNRCARHSLGTDAMRRIYLYAQALYSPKPVINERALGKDLANKCKVQQQNIMQITQFRDLVCPCLSALSLKDRQMLLCSTPFCFKTVKFYLHRDDPASFFLSNFIRTSQRFGQTLGSRDPLAAQLLAHQQIEFAFVSEFGVDQGGLSREAYRLVIDSIARSPLVFRKLGGRFYPCGVHWQKPENPMTKKALASAEDQYLTLGLALGMMLQKSCMCSDLFPDVFYYFLMTETVPDFGSLVVQDSSDFDVVQDSSTPTLADLAREADSELTDGLLKLLKLSSEEVDSLELEWSYSTTYLGGQVEVPLRGHKLGEVVAGKDAEEYVKLTLECALYSPPVQEAFKIIRRGLYAVQPQFKFLDRVTGKLVFTPGELRRIASGCPVVSLEKLKAICVYKGEYKEDHPTIQNFWKLMGQLNAQQRTDFVKFVFATPREPVDGFQHFAISSNKNAGGYPVAHTCSYTLDLPVYKTFDVLKERLLVAIQNNEGFGLM